MTSFGTTRPRDPGKRFAPGRMICFGTHHKTGTIWMKRTLRRVSAEQGIHFEQVYRPKRMADLPADAGCIVVNWKSTYPRQMLEHPEARFVHIIRDPRDVLLSGMRYHRQPGLGNERFLREVRPEWNGMDYRDYLNSLPTEVDQLLFEMENKHDETLRQMLAWDYDHPHSIELAFEDLVEDTDCSLFRRTLERCGIPGLDVDGAVKAYWDLALFGGLADEKNRTNRQKQHVASGKAAQWVEKLPREVAEIYEERYGRALRKLGYETSPDWVKVCKPAATLAMAS